MASWDEAVLGRWSSTTPLCIRAITLVALGGRNKNLKNEQLSRPTAPSSNRSLGFQPKTNLYSAADQREIFFNQVSRARFDTSAEETNGHL